MTHSKCSAGCCPRACVEPTRGWRLEVAAQRVAQATQTLPLYVEARLGKATRSGETDDVRDVLGAGAKSPFLVGAEQERLERGSAADIRRTNALGRVTLVTGD